jgi:hypothetical protein
MFRILFGLSVLCLATAALAAEPTFKIQLSKGNDTATVRDDGKRTVVEIVSESGIGKATITEGSWPRHVTLRFRYKADKPFTTLEGFKLRTDRLLVNGGTKTAGKLPLFFADAMGQFDRDDSHPAGFLNVAVKPVDNALELTLPANLLQGTKKVELEWIDVYR